MECQKKKIRERLEILRQKRKAFVSEVCKKIIEIEAQERKIENFFRP